MRAGLWLGLSLGLWGPGAWGSGANETGLGDSSPAGVPDPRSQTQRRARRQTDAGQCVGPCLGTMSSAMGAHMESTQGILSYSLYDERKLAAFCRSYRRGKLCLEECGASRLRDLMLNTFAAIDFICIDRHDELLRHIPCYARAEPAFRSQCAQRCGGSDELRRIKAEQDSLGSPAGPPGPHANIQGLASVLEEMCSVLDCELACQAGVIRSICGRGTGAEDFLRAFATEGARPLERMLWDAGAVNYWPDSCDKLASQAERLAPRRLGPLLLAGLASLLLYL